MTKMLLALGAIAVTNLGGAVAIAESTQNPVVVVAEPEPATTRRVSFADLDLATSEGERMLNRRVRTAVSQVCAVEVGPSSIFYVEYACRKLTWRDTQPQIRSAVSRAREMAGGNASTAAATIVVRATW